MAHRLDDAWHFLAVKFSAAGTETLKTDVRASSEKEVLGTAPILTLGVRYMLASFIEQPVKRVEGNGTGRTRTADARFRKPLPGVQTHLLISTSAQNIHKNDYTCLLLTTLKDVS